MRRMKPKEARKLTVGLLLVGFVVALGGYLVDWLFMTGTAVMISALVPHFLWNRCPHCGKQLGRNEGTYCQFCGEKIDE